MLLRRTSEEALKSRNRPCAAPAVRAVCVICARRERFWSSPPKATCGGFTLIELIIVMTLLTIALGLAAPRLSSFFHGRTLDYEARRLLTMTRYGQDRAVSLGLPVRLWFDAGAGGYGVEPDPSYFPNADVSEQFQLDTSIQLLASQPKTLPSASSHSPGTPARSNTTQTKYSQYPAIRFLPDGTIEETSPERITLTDQEEHAVVLVLSRNRLGYELSAR